MALPKRQPEEMQGDFVVRCMLDVEATADIPDSNKRFAACVREAKKETQRRRDIPHSAPLGAVGDGGDVATEGLSVAADSFVDNSIVGGSVIAEDKPGHGRRRRIKRASIHTISLVPKGANKMPVLYKSEGENASFSTLLKDDLLDKGELTSVVYAPEIRDSQGDIADEQAIKEMAYDFARRGLGDVTLRHDGKSLSRNDVHVAESFLIQKGDARFANMKDYDGNPVDVTGGWAVVFKIYSEQLRTLYREGKWGGVSMEGPAELVIEKDSGDSFLRSLGKLFSSWIGKSPSANTDEPDAGELDMNADELKKILAENNKTILGDVTKMIRQSKHSAELLKAANVEDGDSDQVVDLKVSLHKATTGKGVEGNAPATKTPSKEKPVFKGDVSDAKAVGAFSIEVRKWEITKDLDMTDPTAIAKANEQIAAIDAGEPIEEEAPAAPAVRKAASNQPVAPGTGATLNKEAQAQVDAGRDMAAIAAEMRGEKPDVVARIRKGAA